MYFIILLILVLAVASCKCKSWEEVGGVVRQLGGVHVHAPVSSLASQCEDGVIC